MKLNIKEKIRQYWEKKFIHHCTIFNDGFERIRKNPFMMPIIGRFIDSHCDKSQSYEKKLIKYFHYSNKKLNDLFYSKRDEKKNGTN